MGHKSKNTIGKVGYHITPKYDLHFLRKKRNHKAKGSSVPELPLVSLIDMFTILVIFLLMNFSTEGEGFFIPKSVKLPLAQNSSALKTAPLISIFDNKINLETQKTAQLQSISLTEDLNSNLASFVEALEDIKKSFSSHDFKGQINIQADEIQSLDVIKRIMKICVENGFSKINFVVRSGQ